MNNICVIPARAGSKRILKKNIREFNGKPMIYWSIKNALASNCFSKVIVSTDSQEIAEISKDAGAETPFIRPKNLADDFTSTIDVIKHAIYEINLQNIDCKYICCLYATTPLLGIDEINIGLKNLLNSDDKFFVFSATNYEYPINKALYLDEFENARMVNNENLNKRTQDLKYYFHDAGQFYWGSIDAWTNAQNILDGSKPLFLPNWKVLDIDNQEDWERAEFIHKFLMQKKKN